MTIDAVIFDLDGVLIDSEPIWSEVRHSFVDAHGGHWAADADRRMMGMASMEWAEYLHRELGVAMPPDEIVTEVVDRMVARYGQELPLVPGATEAVTRLAARWPLGLASSSPVRLITPVLRRSGLAPMFRVATSTEEIGVGKPAPDVYLSVARDLGVEPGGCAAVEDSTNGLRAARAAGMRVIAVPMRAFPPDPDELDRADAVVASLRELTGEVVDPSDGG
jgi:HAD superfamily hydrolase (TIGR01509 family)